MRLVVISGNTDFRALVKDLRRRSPAGGSKAAITRLRELNPHIKSLEKIEPGTPVLVPDLQAGTEQVTTTAETLGTDAFDALASDIAGGLGAAVERAKSERGKLGAAHAEMQTVLKTSAVRRAIAVDPLLKQQAGDAQERLRRDLDQAQPGIEALEAIRKGAAAELASLRKLLG